MGRMIFAILVTAAIGTPVRAEVIKYQCTGGSGTVAITVDTKTLTSVVSGNGVAVPGQAQVSNTQIVLTENGHFGWSETIDRKTGAAVDTDGDTETCRRVK